MPQHPALSEDRVAVITGGASGIGLAAAKRFASIGMKLVLADLSQDALDKAAAQLAGDEVNRLKDRAYAAFGAVDVLMNNTGTSPGGGPFDHYERWQRVLAVNLWGVINGVHAFTQAMIDQKTPGAIVNTGSKQGITCPPGDTANITKAGVKVRPGARTLAAQHRGLQDHRAPAGAGSTFTGMTARGRTEKPPGSWTPDQVIDVLVERMGNAFLHHLPRQHFTTDVDNRRILWGAEDIIRNRPPLSRWHPDARRVRRVLASPSPFRQSCEVS
jgi:hypothetical protein